VSTSRREEQATSVVNQQLEELNELLKEAPNTDSRLAHERLRRWKEKTVQLLAETVSETESRTLSEKRLGSFVMGQPLRNLLSEGGMYRAFMLALLDDLQKDPRRIVRVTSSSTEISAVAVPEPTASRTVFLIHGHDELNLLRLRVLLKDRWNVDSIVLREKPGKGRTLIEKFENEATAATFAIALMSPDDVVECSGPSYPQARPNVVFELGWFYGRLGRERVCIVMQKGTKIHSDLDGISRIDFQDSVENVVADIEKELKAAGLV